MNPEFNFLPINWVDGMKISKKHLIGLENSLLDYIKDAASISLNDFNYGLLAATEIGREPFGVDLDSERIEIYKCRALTRDGFRIEIVDENIPTLRKPIHELIGERDLLSASEWYVFIRVNLFKRTPVGTPDPDEEPLRAPFAVPTYSLNLVSQDQINARQLSETAIPIAKIITSSRGLEFDQEYIPPTAILSNVQMLFEEFVGFKTILNEIENSLVEITLKVQQKRERKENNNLTEDIGLVTTKIMNFFTENIDSYRLLVPSQPPLFMELWFIRMARVIKSNLRFLRDLEGMMKYFEYYIKDVHPVAFQKIIDDMCLAQYDHLNIRKSVDNIQLFLTFLNQLFNNLKKLDFKEFGNPSIIKYSSGGSPSIPTNNITEIKKGPRIFVRRPKARGASSERPSNLGDDLE